MTACPGAYERANDARREDLAWLADTGETTHGAAARIGVNRDALYAWCHEHAPEVWDQLLNNEHTPGHGARQARVRVSIR